MYKQEVFRKQRSSECSVESPIATNSEKTSEIINKQKQDNLHHNGKNNIEFEHYTNSPKIRKKKDLEFSLSKIDELVLNNDNKPPCRDDTDYESPHNFLVTLCHQNKNLINSSFDYV